MATPPETNLIDLFNHALCKTLLEDPSDVKKMIKQLDSIVKNVKNMKKSIQQMLVRNQPDVAATLQMPSLRRLSMRSKVLGK